MPAKGKVATAYFTCGTFLRHNIIADQEGGLDHCDFVINSETYSRLHHDMIGRLELPPGRYLIKQADDDGSVPSKTVDVNLSAGETVLFKATYTKSQSMGGALILGPMGGEAFGSSLANVEVFKNPRLTSQKEKTPVNFRKKSD